MIGDILSLLGAAGYLIVAGRICSRQFKPRLIERVMLCIGSVHMALYLLNDVFDFIK